MRIKKKIILNRNNLCKRRIFIIFLKIYKNSIECTTAVRICNCASYKIKFEQEDLQEIMNID